MAQILTGDALIEKIAEKLSDVLDNFEERLNRVEEKQNSYKQIKYQLHQNNISIDRFRQDISLQTEQNV